MTRAIRILLIAIAVAAVLCLGAIVAIKSVLSPEALRQRAMDELAAFTGRTVTITGPVTLHFFPGVHVSFEGLSIANPAHFSAPDPFLSIRKAEASLRLKPLFHHVADFKYIRIEGLHINAIRDAAGKNNWTFTPPELPEDGIPGLAHQDEPSGAEGKSGAASPPTTSANSTNGVAGHEIKAAAPASGNGMSGGANGNGTATNGKAAPEPRLRLAAVDISNATISYSDARTGENVRTRALDFGLKTLDGGTAAFTLSCSLASSKPELQGDLLASGTLGPRTKRVLKVSLAPLTFTPHGGILAPATGPLELRGQFTINNKAQTIAFKELTAATPYIGASGEGELGTGPALSASLKLKGDPRKGMAAFGVLYPTAKATSLSSADLELKLDLTKDRLSLENVKGSIDSTTVTGNMSVSLDAPYPITGDLALGVLDIGDYLPTADKQAQPGKQPGSQPLSQSTKHPPVDGSAANSAGKKDEAGFSFKTLRLDAALKADKLIFNKLTVRELATRIRIQDRMITADETRCRMFDGLIKGRLGVDLRQSAPAYSTTLDASGVNVGSLLQTFTGSRSVDAQGEIHGTTTASGTSPQALLSSLNGHARLVMRDITLHEMNAVPEGSPQVQNKRWQRFSLLTATLNAHNGIVRNDDLYLRGNDINVEGQGIINLPADSLAYIGTVNIKGLPGIPVRVRGTLSDPEYGIDPARMVVNTLQGAGKLLEKPAEMGGKVLKGFGDLLKNLVP